MPQFDLTWYPSQIFWLIVCFVILYIAMRYFLLPPLQEIMKERDHKIQSILRQADKFNAEADRLLQEYQKYIDQASTHSAQVLQTAHDEISADYEAQEEKIQARLKKNSLKAEEEVTKVRHVTLNHLEMIITQFIEILMKSVYGMHPNKKVLEKSVSKAMKEKQ